MLGWLSGCCYKIIKGLKWFVHCYVLLRCSSWLLGCARWLLGCSGGLFVRVNWDKVCEIDLSMLSTVGSESTVLLLCIFKCNSFLLELFFHYKCFHLDNKKCNWNFCTIYVIWVSTSVKAKQSDLLYKQVCMVSHKYAH